MACRHIREGGNGFEKLRKGVVEGADGIRQPDGDSRLAEEQPGFGVPHSGRLDASVTRHRLDEQAVDAIHLGLEEGMGFAGDRLVRVEVVLAVTGKHGGVANTVLRVLLRLVDMHGDDANRANATGARDEHLAGSRCQCVGR